MKKTEEFDPFADVENAKRSVRGAYIDAPGRHTLTVESMKFVISQNPSSRGKAYFVADFSVKESKSYEVGESRTWMQDLMKPSPESAIAAVRELLSAASGKPESELTRDVCTELVDETQPLQGATVVCDARTISTKRGTDFTLCVWRKT